MSGPLARLLFRLRPEEAIALAFLLPTTYLTIAANLYAREAGVLGARHPGGVVRLVVAESPGSSTLVPPCLRQLAARAYDLGALQPVTQVADMEEHSPTLLMQLRRPDLGEGGAHHPVAASPLRRPRPESVYSGGDEAGPGGKGEGEQAAFGSGDDAVAEELLADD